MKKILNTAFFMIFALTFMAAIRSNVKAEDEIARDITGSWHYKGFYYVFNTDGTMKAVKTAGETIGYSQYKYSKIRMGGNDYIRFAKKLDDTTPFELLFVGDVTDSTAIISFGTAFVRADSSDGITGTWKHVEGRGTMIWKIDKNSIQYTESVFDMNTAEFRVIEKRQGIYIRDKYKKDVFSGEITGGKYHITFSDGTSKTILPVVHENLMYLFDLSPTKSKFTKVDPDSVPDYKTYRAVLKNRNNG
ncbi:MAG: hypothetical protein JXB48_22910 [Candidatus Latescibacteria bacterium]|nr:hypothetical protein [Candidatus Latescibacterota bacterium]